MPSTAFGREQLTKKVPRWLAAMAWTRRGHQVLSDPRRLTPSSARLVAAPSSQKMTPFLAPRLHIQYSIQCRPSSPMQAGINLTRQPFLPLIVAIHPSGSLDLGQLLAMDSALAISSKMVAFPSVLLLSTDRLLDSLTHWSLISSRSANCSDSSNVAERQLIRLPPAP